MTDILTASKRYRRAVNKFLKMAAAAEADPEAQESLAKAFDSEAQWFESLIDGRTWTSKTGWFEYLYRDIANTNRGGIMIPDPEGKKAFVIMKPSKKGLKKFTERELLRQRGEHYVIPQIHQAEIFHRKYMLPQKLAKLNGKKPSLSEGAFGAEKGGLLDG